MEEQVIQKIKKGAEQTKKAFRERLITLIMGGFSLVAALAWNDAIQGLFNSYFKESNGLIGKFFYAVLITVIVVIVSIRLEKISDTK